MKVWHYLPAFWLLCNQLPDVNGHGNAVMLAGTLVTLFGAYREWRSRRRG